MRGARVAIAILLIGWTAQAHAQFWRDCEIERAWFTVTPASYHLDRTNDKRERHLGIGFEHACGNWRGVGGVIQQNSNDDITLYVGGAWLPLTWRELHFGGFAGLFTGYSAAVLPAAAFVGAWDGRRCGINLLAFPPYEKEADWLFVLQLKQAF